MNSAETLTKLTQMLEFTAQPLQMSINQTLQLIQNLSTSLTALTKQAQPLIETPQIQHFAPLLPLLSNVEFSFSQIEKFEEIADLLELILVNLEDVQYSRKPKGLKKLLKGQMNAQDEAGKVEVSKNGVVKTIEKLTEMECYSAGVKGQEVVFGMQRKRAEKVENVPVKQAVVAQKEVKQEVVQVKRGLVINAEDEESD